MAELTDLFVTISLYVDAAGVFLIILGILIASIRYLIRLVHKDSENHNYSLYRKELGRSLLLCLEFLVAADIIRTVAVDPSLQSLLVLFGLIFIRTFLSAILELEITGLWPWQKSQTSKADSPEIAD